MIRPHDIEAEQAILGALLLTETNDLFHDVAAMIDGGDFYDPVHARIWDAIEGKAKVDALASPITLKPIFANDEGMAEVGGVDYLARLAGATVSIRGTYAYAEVVRDLSRRRTALSAMEEASARIAGMEGITEALSALEGALSHSEEKGPADAMTLGQALTKAAERMNDAFNGDTPPGISIGIPEIASGMGNLHPGEVLLIGARPSMGKSALAIDIAKRVAQNSVGCVYWCGEMAEEDNAERLMSSEAAKAGSVVSYHLARQGRMREEQFKALLEAARSMEDLPLMLIDPAIKRLDRLCHSIRRQVKKLRKKHEHCIVIVDYIQQIMVDKSSRFEVVTEVSQQLKALAIELRVPMIVLSQLSRKVEERDDKRPRLADLRESGQLEQDANAIAFLFREDYYLEREMSTSTDETKASKRIARLDEIRGQLDFIVAKQRSGPLFTATLGFDGSTNSITSLGADAGQETFV